MPWAFSAVVGLAGKRRFCTITAERATELREPSRH